MRILYNEVVRMKYKDRLGWHMLLDLLLKDIERTEKDECDCVEGMEGVMHHGHNHEDGYLLDEIDKHFKGKATNAYGIEIDFDEIRKAKNMYDAENIDDE
jgi:hypothetical protein